MAKTNNKRKKQTPKGKSFSEAIGLQYIFNNTITDFLIGFALALLAVLMIIAMASYLNTGAADQSILEDLRQGDWTNSGRALQNYGGSIGSLVSYYLISVCFGLPAFLIPLYVILVGLKLMSVYNVNLLKWFFYMVVVMLWCSITFAKFLTPVLGSLIFNPGGGHGLFVVQKLEDLVGPPGLTALLLFVAVAFLTFITSETITFIRKALNPIGYISSKVKFTITNGSHDEDSTDDTVSAYADDTDSDDTLSEDNVPEASMPEEEPYNSKLEDFPLTTTTMSVTTADDNVPAEAASNTIDLDITQAPPVEQATEETAEDGLDMDITVGQDEEKATSDTAVSTQETSLSTPINPKEPFTNYKYPTLSLLKKYDDNQYTIDKEEQENNKNRIIEVLGYFGIQIKSIRATVGPTITLYEIQPADGVRISKIKNLEDDIALSLAALGIRIIAPIPGKGTIGIEVPNANANIVSMESILNSRKFQETKMDLPLALGKTITNEVFMVDLAKIPHLLVAGATGQGKSVGLNAIITSLLYKKHPNELKLVLIDPKKVEFSVYARIANKFMAAAPGEEEPIITDVTKVVRTLNSLCVLMDSRYDLLKKAGARNIKEYNQKFINHRLRLTDGHDFMPYIVVIIDEFGDLIMTAGKEVELPIARIAQLARAVGIHMVIATQRPTTSIITGNIKANFPGRIAFKVTSGIDSKTILDRPGANQLIGRGDMLYLNGNDPVRVQCAFVDTPEIESINEFISEQLGPLEPLELPEPSTDSDGSGVGSSVDTGSLDAFFEEAAHAIVISQQGSTSMIQRRFSIGYNRAGRLMDQLEAAGIVGPAQGSKPRDVLVPDDAQLNILLAQIRG